VAKIRKEARERQCGWWRINMHELSRKGRLLSKRATLRGCDGLRNYLVSHQRSSCCQRWRECYLQATFSF
jgi:hypothetical protein